MDSYNNEPRNGCPIYARTIARAWARRKAAGDRIACSRAVEFMRKFAAQLAREHDDFNMPEFIRLCQGGAL